MAMGKGQRILIDGYNLIYADEALRRLLERGPEAARTELVARLERYAEQKEMRITVVFDGTGRMLDATPVLPGKLQTVFSRGDQSADELIVSMLEDASNPREFMVVTSDNEDIGRTARALGATVLPSQAFLERLSARTRRAPSIEEKPDPFDDDVDYWLRKFGEIE
jgi:predicted RNA-binding protein with PIN domain